MGLWRRLSPTAETIACPEFSTTLEGKQECFVYFSFYYGFVCAQKWIRCFIKATFVSFMYHRYPAVVMHSETDKDARAKKKSFMVHTTACHLHHKASRTVRDRERDVRRSRVFQEPLICLKCVSHTFYRTRSLFRYRPSLSSARCTRSLVWNSTHS